MTNTTGEMSDPERELPRAMCWALIIVMPVYPVAGLAFLIVSGTVSVGHLRVRRETGARR